MRKYLILSLLIPDKGIRGLGATTQTTPTMEYQVLILLGFDIAKPHIDFWRNINSFIFNDNEFVVLILLIHKIRYVVRLMFVRELFSA